MRDKLKRDFTRPVTWNEVLSYFFTELKTQATRIKELEAQVEELGGKVEHKTEVIEEVLLNLSRQAAAPVMMQANPTLISQPQTLVAPPALPPPPPISPKAPTFIKELNGKFVAGALKPSEICSVVFKEPKYLEEEN
jgi:hypothetical protein